MDCEQAWLMMEDLLDGDIDASARRDLERHMAACETCARHYDEIDRVEQWARGLAPVSPAAGFTQRVMARIADEQQPVATAGVATGLAILVAVLIAAAVIPTIVGGGAVVVAWVEGVVVPTGSTLSAAVAGVAEAGRAVYATVASLWGSVEYLHGPFSPMKLPLIAVVAFLLLAVFNAAQVRATARER